jgi:hypothetical protein
MCSLIAKSRNQVDFDFLPKGLHDIGANGMRDRLQQAVDATPAGYYEAILMGYALCGTGLTGLTARDVPIVLPRGHDCMTLFMGSKERYLDYFTNNAGVYFRTTGWLERGGQLDQLSIQSAHGLGAKYEDLVVKYGEENAAYLAEQLGMLNNYKQLTYIEMGIEPDDSFERRSREEAERRGWSFEKISGDMSLLKALVEGEWDKERFLVVKPGQRIVARYDDNIMDVEDVPSA